jgi:hypothetical protein
MPDPHSQIDSRYARLVFDGQSFLVPQNQIPSVEPNMDLDMRSGPAGSVGEVVLSGRHWPVYSLDRNLDLIGEVPPERSICVLVSGALGGFGITCDELTTLETDDVRMHPIPGCMRTPDLLAESLAVHDGRVVCVLSAESIARRVERSKPGELSPHSQARPAEVGAL